MHFFLYSAGSQLFPAEPDPASKVNVSETRLKSLVTSISKSLELKMASDFETFEARFMRDLDDHITAVSSFFLCMFHLIGCYNFRIL